jgi:hypothetical protein
MATSSASAGFRPRAEGSPSSPATVPPRFRAGPGGFAIDVRRQRAGTGDFWTVGRVGAGRADIFLSASAWQGPEQVLDSVEIPIRVER